MSSSQIPISILPNADGNGGRPPVPRLTDLIPIAVWDVNKTGGPGWRTAHVEFSQVGVPASIPAVIAALWAYRIVTIAGSVTVGPSDASILINKTVAATTNIILPTAASRSGVPLTVKDYKGDANTNNIRFVLDGVETIDGFAQAAADANGASLIDINYGKKTLFPLVSGGWYL